MKIKNLGIKLDILGLSIIFADFIFALSLRGNRGIFSWEAITFLLVAVTGLIIIKEISPRVRKKRGEKVFNTISEVVQYYWPSWYKKHLEHKQKLKKFEEG